MHKTIRIIVSISRSMQYFIPRHQYGLIALEFSVATSSMYNIIPILHTDIHCTYDTNKSRLTIVSREAKKKQAVRDGMSVLLLV